jgi:polyribonucleotide nucleotidyltransferase
VKEVHSIVLGIQKLQKTYGKIKRNVEPPAPIPDNVMEAVKSMCETRIREILRDFSHDKLSRDDAVSQVRIEVIEKLVQDGMDANSVIDAFNKMFKEVFRTLIFEEDLR